MNGWNDISDILGWLSRDEAETLYSIARDIPHPSTIIEIGSYCGRSTSCFALGLRDSPHGSTSRIISIDHHLGSPEIVHGPTDTFPHLQKTLKHLNLSSFVIPIVASSRQASHLHIPCDVLFIDGDHRLEFVDEDSRLWMPQIKNCGIALFHDYRSAEGPRIVVDRLIATHSWRVQFQVDDLIGLERVSSPAL